eukprot:29717-Chlamydomonas_euryale.AAC.10
MPQGSQAPAEELSHEPADKSGADDRYDDDFDEAKSTKAEANGQADDYADDFEDGKDGRSEGKNQADDDYGDDFDEAKSTKSAVKSMADTNYGDDDFEEAGEESQVWCLCTRGSRGFAAADMKHCRGLGMHIWRSSASTLSTSALHHVGMADAKLGVKPAKAAVAEAKKAAKPAAMSSAPLGSPSKKPAPKPAAAASKPSSSPTRSPRGAAADSPPRYKPNAPPSLPFVDPFGNAPLAEAPRRKVFMAPAPNNSKFSFSAAPACINARRTHIRADYSHSPNDIWNMQRQNKALCQRLLDISKAPLAPEYWQRVEHGAAGALSSQTKARQRHEQEIVKGNLQLYKRIQAAKPSSDVSRKKLEKDYEKSQMHVKHLRKFKGTPALTMKSKQAASVQHHGGNSEALVAHAMAQEAEEQAGEAEATAEAAAQPQEELPFDDGIQT